MVIVLLRWEHSFSYCKCFAFYLHAIELVVYSGALCEQVKRTIARVCVCVCNSFIE